MRWTRQSLAASVPVAVVAVIAAVISYGHIESLALAEHQSITAARLLPLAVDALIVAGSVILLAGSRMGWLCVVSGVAGTLFANVESGVRFGPLAATVAAWPAVAFVVSSFVLERWLARSRTPDAVPVPADAHPAPGRTQARAPAKKADRTRLAGADKKADRTRQVRADNPGLTQEDIAARLGITARTVRRHLAGDLVPASANGHAPF